MTLRINGHRTKSCTALEYWGNPPDDLDDAYVVKGASVKEVWDVGIERTKDGKIALYGSWPDAFNVTPETPIFYTVE